MPTATQITVTQLDMTGARCPALFCSGAAAPQTPRPPARSPLAISRAVQQVGIGGCADRMAQESGDHPDVGGRNRHRATRRTRACIP